MQCNEHRSGLGTCVAGRGGEDTCCDPEETRFDCRTARQGALHFEVHPPGRRQEWALTSEGCPSQRRISLYSTQYTVLIRRPDTTQVYNKFSIYNYILTDFPVAAQHGGGVTVNGEGHAHLPLAELLLISRTPQ